MNEDNDNKYEAMIQGQDKKEPTKVLIVGHVGMNDMIHESLHTIIHELEKDDYIIINDPKDMPKEALDELMSQNNSYLSFKEPIIHPDELIKRIGDMENRKTGVLTPHELPAPYVKPLIPKGHKMFIVNGEEVWAMNRRNAIKRYDKK